MYQHHIILKVKEELTSELALDFRGIVKRFGPEGVIFAYNHGDKKEAMEYGFAEGEEMGHCYTIPLIRDFTQDEAAIVVAAWDYKFVPDFDIEISNQYQDASDYEIDIDEAVKEQAVFDLNKWHHNRWKDQMMGEGWHYGLRFSESNKSHPALRDWDSLPESHRRSPLFDDKEVFEWLRKNGVS